MIYNKNKEKILGSNKECRKHPNSRCKQLNDMQ